MKLFFALMILAASLSAFAEGQTTTECPMMKQQRRGTNPKASLEVKDVKQEVKSTVVTGQ